MCDAAYSEAEVLNLRGTLEQVIAGTEALIVGIKEWPFTRGTLEQVIAGTEALLVGIKEWPFTKAHVLVCGVRAIRITSAANAHVMVQMLIPLAVVRTRLAPWLWRGKNRPPRSTFLKLNAVDLAVDLQSSRTGAS